MTPAEAVGLVTRIALFYPGWLRGMEEEETKRVLLAWAGELAPLGNREEVWAEALDCLRKHERPWPPSVFELRGHINGRLRAKRERQARPVLPPSWEGSAETARAHLEEIHAILNGRKKAHARPHHTRAMGHGETPGGLAQPDTRMDGGVP